jgi:hypothetical protein
MSLVFYNSIFVAGTDVGEDNTTVEKNGRVER